MSRNSTIGLVVVAAVAVSVPLVPDKDKYIINVTEPIAKQKNKKQYEIVTTTCNLQDFYTTSQGLKVCEYKCNTPSKQSIYKTSRPEVVCQDSITEKIQRQKNN